MLEQPVALCFEELVPGKEYQTVLPAVRRGDEEVGACWGKDEISPATSMFSHREANPYLLWTHESLNRRIDGALTLVYLLDRSTFVVRNEII